MAEPRALPIYLAGRPETLPIATIKQAKAELQLDYNIIPRGHSTAPGRILAIDGPPPTMGDYLLVSRDCSVEEMKRALRWVLGEVEHDDQATLFIDQLQAIMPGAREMTPEELASEQAMKDFVSEGPPRG